MKETSLAEKYIEFEKTITPETTVDDFFDHCNIPVHMRTDFGFAAIMKQVTEKEKMDQQRLETAERD